MDFSLSEEQRMLQDSVAKFVAQDYDFYERCKFVNTELGYNAKNWKLFAELGWLMVPFSEEDGGMGGSAVDLMVMMQELGKGLVVEPFLASTVLAGGLLSDLATVAQKQQFLPELIEGRMQLAFAFAEPQSRYTLSEVSTLAKKDGDDYLISGHKTVVLNGASADYLLVAVRTAGEPQDSHGISVMLVAANAEGVARQCYTNVDGHKAADIIFDKVRVAQSQLLGAKNEAYTAIEKAVDRATLALCAEAVGAMEVTYRKTVEYTKTRKQFGVPIASFQALQHRMADMFIECEQARSLLIMAAMFWDANDPMAKKYVSAAKSRVGKAARKIGQEAVQLHGGIGVTNELDVGHFFKRLTTVQYLFGSTDFHTQRYIGCG